MELNWLNFIIVCPLVFLAGFVDSIAGGGGLISLPAYLLAGVNPKLAIGTNKLSSSFGTFFSTARYCKNGHFDLAIAIPSVFVAIIGSYIGARLVLITDEKILSMLLLFILPIVVFFVFRKGSLEENSVVKITRKRQIILGVLVSGVIGMYDGFYGPGTGTFLVLAYVGLVKMDLLKAMGNTKIINLSSNLAALCAFMLNGNIIYLLGLTAAIFSIAGNLVGSSLAMKNGSRVVKPVIIVVLVLLFVKICFRI